MGSRKDKKIKTFENQVQLIEILERKYRKKDRMKLFRSTQ